MDVFGIIERSARSRLAELDGLYRDLAEMRPSDRDDVQDALIVLREEEIARVLEIIAACVRARGRVVREG